jgi:hypothetical protein
MQEKSELARRWREMMQEFMKERDIYKRKL